MNERMQGYFDTHKSVDKIYTTSDGQAFLDEAKASVHAATLKDKKVKAYERSEGNNGNSSTSSEAVEAAKEKLLALDFSVEPKMLVAEELQKIKTALGLISIGNKKSTLIEVLAAEQARLKEAADSVVNDENKTDKEQE